MNGGLQVVNPSSAVYNLILEHMESGAAIDMDFADQSLLSDLFRGCWVPLPYIYNALKTLRWEGVHKPIWQDDKVKNVHYILAPKPWDEEGDQKGKSDPTHAWWWGVNDERLSKEKETGVVADGY
jgi:lipopolysaccharide biosynthesis glycosyltransferase